MVTSVRRATPTLTRDHDVCTLLITMVDEGAQISGFKLIITSLMLAFLAMTTVMIFQWARYREPYVPPCGYGSSEILVREADGKARVVCGCPLPGGRN